MARLFQSGYESGDITLEPFTQNAVTGGGGAVSVVSGGRAPGTRCGQYTAVAGAGSWGYSSVTVTGAGGRAYFASCYLQFPTALPSAAVAVLVLGSSTGTFLASARVTSAGKLQLWNEVAGTQVGSDSAAAITAGTWHRVDASITVGSGARDALELRLDGTVVASASAFSLSDTLFGGVRFGLGESTAVAVTLLVDDVAINDATGDVDAAYPAGPTVLGVYDVRAFGAAGDGATDDTAAIQAAVNAAGGVGVVSFPPATYNVTTIALPNAKTTLIGYGAVVNTQTAGSYAFTQANRQRTVLRGLKFVGSGSGFRFAMSPSDTQSYDLSAEDCDFVLPSAQYGINLTGAREATITNCYFETCTGVYLHQAANAHVVGCQFKNCAAGIFGDGSATGSSYDAGLMATDITAIGCTYGVRCIGWDYVAVVNSMIDYCANPIAWVNVGPGVLLANYLSDQENGSSINPVVSVTTDTTTYPTNTPSGHIRIVGNTIVSRSTTASQAVSTCVLIGTTDHVTFTDNQVDFWRQYGVKFTGVCNYVVARGNHFGPAPGATDPTTTGALASIYGTAGNDSTWVFQDNYFGKKPLNTSFAVWGRDNQGFASDVSGTATIAASTTSIVVTHGLAKTPTYVQATAAGNVGAVWATAIGATTFTLNCATAPAGATTVFYRAWFVNG